MAHQGQDAVQNPPTEDTAAASIRSQDEPIIQRPLEAFDVACLIINKMIGSGIFIQPSAVLLLTGSKVGALFIWVFGAVYSFCSIYVYLEYGLAWPFSGGEYVYIKKIFPRPALVFASSFAWFFVAFSSSTGNALIFARYICMTNIASPNEWLQKFIACWILVGISIIHYRTVNIGITANAFLAAYKLLLLLILIAAGLFGGLPRESRHKGIQGNNDWRVEDSGNSPVNITLAIFLVIYAYQGWENANYITSEIAGNTEQKKRNLKVGALGAVTVVSALYIGFNFVLFFLLSYEDITTTSTLQVTYLYVLQAFGPGDETAAKQAVYACIALSAFGNLVGVIFTNARVKREIARDQLVPAYSFFVKSSDYGRNRDGFGTPIGGLILHGLISCILVAATPFSGSSLDGLTFIYNLYTYGHSVLRIALGIGLFYLRRRMNENETAAVDIPDEAYDVPWNYKLLTKKKLRYLLAVFLIATNTFLVILPVVPSTTNPDGSKRLIPFWLLPTTILPVYVVGGLAAIMVLLIAPRMYFQTSLGTSRNEFVPYNARRWVIVYPEVGDVLGSLCRRDIGQFFEDTKTRLWYGGEATEARRLKEEMLLQPVAAEGGDHGAQQPATKHGDVIPVDGSER